ncbi:MAG: hypothetical protein IKG40_04710 [Bacilli bacterium]|nr:hypothetical protein [Bacilli bacterium]
MIYFIISLVTYFTFLILKGRKYLSYLSNKKNNQKKIKPFTLDKYLTPELFGIVLIILVFFLNSKIIGILFIIFYTILSLIEIRNSNSIKLNKNTKKIIIITIIIYLTAFIIIFIDYYNYQKGFIFYNRTNYYYILVFILGYLEYAIIYLSHKIVQKKSKKTKK